MQMNLDFTEYGIWKIKRKASGKQNSKLNTFRQTRVSGFFFLNIFNSGLIWFITAPLP